MTFERDVSEIARLLEAWAERCRPMMMVDLPEEVRVGELNADGWAEWRLIPSPVAPADVDALEAALGVRLPPFYRAFLCCRVLIDFDFGAYALASVTPQQPLDDVADLLRAPTAEGFITFGSARGCGDPLCFDLSRATPDGDYAVVVFNHDVVPSKAWSDPVALRPYVGVVAPSFRSFLTSLLTDDPAIHPPPESPEELRRSAAWSRVRQLNQEKGFHPDFRPAGVSPNDPWAIAEALERRP